MKITAKHRCHGGVLHYVEHQAKTTNCKMRFSIFIPPQAENNDAKHSALFYLSGLTCTEENFTTKANAYKKAAELGLIIIAPDTSPRGKDVPDDEGYDLGQGAGFYLNATQEPWRKNYKMESYIVEELRQLILHEFPVDADKIGIFGHSMGGHGALTLHLKNPDIFKSISALAPICAPTQGKWGHKILPEYLGSDEKTWINYDATELMKNSASSKAWNGKNRSHILIDQGLEDEFLAEGLRPDLLALACKTANHPLVLRYHKGYDHGYFFIQTFINDHLEHHNECLKNI